MKTEYKTILFNSSLEILKIKNLNHNFPMHIHKRICMGRIDSGTKTLFIDQKRIQLKKNDIFLIPAYKPHMCLVNADCTVSYTIICLDNFNESFNRDGYDILFSRIIKNKRISSLIRNYDGKKPINLVIKNYKINKILNFIEDNYMNELSVDYLAGNACLSPYHLLHIFKKVVGISLHQYIIQTRVKKFKERIMNHKNTLDTALSCGFYDQSHFIKNFKKHVGITPQKYIDSINIANV